jgi:tetratricopeptide (TPR) repeat protein
MIVALVFSSLNVQAQSLQTPRAASPAAEVSQTIGFTDITVNYSRPKLVDRRGQDRSGQIWGQLVPYGFNQNFRGIVTPWRAGANENTIITFSDDVKIQGKDLAAGTYGLHIAVYEDDKATIIFSKNTSSWGSYFYDEAEDLLRVNVITKKTTKTQVLTYDFIDFGSDFTVLALRWDDKEIPFKITIDGTALVMQNFRDQLRSLTGFGWQGHQAAAAYTLGNNVNLEEGLAWANIAVQRNSSFPTLTTKAGILNALERYDEANAIFDKAVENATIAQINQLGYQFLGANQYEKAIEYFLKNVKKDPKSANGFDSLGDAYKAKGDKVNAIKNYKKALSLNPAANVKAASEASLKELGAM